MTEHRFIDRAAIGGTRRTDDGYLVAEAFAVRTGIQIYTGAEVGLADRDMVRVWRPEEEVRSVDSMRTFTHAPITLGHPAEMVTADNWKDLAKGEVSTEATWAGNKIKLPLIVKDAEAIAAIEAGTRELSAGYTCALDFTDGTTPEGEAYDAVQRNIRINHVAIVPRGRAGSECRIGDADHWGASPLDAGKEDLMTLRKIMVDGLEVETTDAGAKAIDKLTAAKDAAETKMADAATKHTEALAAKDKEIADKDAEIEKLKKAQVSDADLDKRVAARADLVAKTKSIANDVKTEGLSDAEIRKAVVKAKLGDEAIKDKSEAYIDARFDILAEDAGAEEDPVRKTVQTIVPAKDAAAKAAEAHAARMKSLADGWKAPVEVKH
jgi:hypothetical protein